VDGAAPMDPRELTAVEIAAYLAPRRRPAAALLRALARDPRASVRRLAARYLALRAAARAESRRLRALYREERRRAQRGLLVAGVDEAGRGPLAGPVVAAAVILPPRPAIPGLDDSKRLRPDARERLDREIRARAVALAVGEASVEEIDRLNILRATRLAMRRAVAALERAPDFLLIDGRERLPEPWPQAAVVGGDGRCACIAAASIVAKVARDRLMRALDEQFPQYGFARHKGYASEAHLAALARYGPCAVHRRAFLPEHQLALFEAL
jgi:ribonuclease HII